MSGTAPAKRKVGSGPASPSFSLLPKLMRYPRSPSPAPMGSSEDSTVGPGGSGGHGGGHGGGGHSGAKSGGGVDIDSFPIDMEEETLAAASAKLGHGEGSGDARDTDAA